MSIEQHEHLVHPDEIAGAARRDTLERWSSYATDSEPRTCHACDAIAGSVAIAAVPIYLPPSGITLPGEGDTTLPVLDVSALPTCASCLADPAIVGDVWSIAAY